MSEIALYMHAGSGNHGCEAIVDSLVRLMPTDTFRLMSNCAQEDEKYLPRDVRSRVEILEERHIDRHFLTHVLYYIYRRVTGDRESFLRYRYKSLTADARPRLAVSIGGDNYCYPSMVDDLMLANAMFARQGTATVLLGCSIEPELLVRNQALLEDLGRYRLIIARESITYAALQRAMQTAYGEDGFRRVILCPDPAFTLPVDESALPEGFASGNTVGINISPMAGDYAASADILYKSSVQLIRHILDHTQMEIALIPHVVWDRSDDRVPLRQIYELFRGTGRVTLVPDLPAEQLKGVIANCRFFIGARTHATIAAYSTLIPTLVLGYSVKSRGIARDLFGTEDHYVLPVQSLQEPQQLVDAWVWLFEHEDEIRWQLTGAIPRIRAAAERIPEELHRVLQSL